MQHTKPIPLHRFSLFPSLKARCGSLPLPSIEQPHHQRQFNCVAECSDLVARHPVSLSNPKILPPPICTSKSEAHQLSFHDQHNNLLRSLPSCEHCCLFPLLLMPFVGWKIIRRLISFPAALSSSLSLSSSPWLLSTGSSSPPPSPRLPSLHCWCRASLRLNRALHLLSLLCYHPPPPSLILVCCFSSVCSSSGHQTTSFAICSITSSPSTVVTTGYWRCCTCSYQLANISSSTVADCCRSTNKQPFLLQQHCNTITTITSSVSQQNSEATSTKRANNSRFRFNVNLPPPHVYSTGSSSFYPARMMGTSRQHYFEFESEFIFFILLSRVIFLVFISLVFLFLVPHRLYRENSIIVSLFKDSIVLNKKYTRIWKKIILGVFPWGACCPWRGMEP